MGRTKPAVIAAALAALALGAVPAALGQNPGNGGLSPPDPATPSGEAINQIYWFVFAICAVVFVAVETALVLFVIRFRRRRSTAEDAEGPQIHGNTRLEIIWTAIPAVILVGIAAVVLARTPAVQATSGDRSNELVVGVQGHQFYWEYIYPDGQISIDRLVVPVDRPVKLELVSFDVNHSWWVPELTGKKDAIPGRTNELRFTPEREGVFEGRCAELCGILHAVMPTTVEVVSQASYAGFLQTISGQEEPGASQLALGRETWDRVCAKCHGLAGEGDIGPPVALSPKLVDRQVLLDLLENGQDLPANEGYMPPVGRGWPDFQVDALIAYVQSNPALAAPPADGGGR
ncbi:MAG TPA: cytochrome c oxidase subunit II [Gaiellaceae bacterium]|nr:cytochrome c oxidase subunit II [Gaiellaceae bacterium]